MKRLLCALGAAVILLLAAGPALAEETKIADVPPDHWAYQAVKKLVAQGYLGLYPDDTFRGDQPVDRYTLAVVVARLVEGSVSGKITLTKEDSDLLRRLTREFREELVSLAARVKSLEEALAKCEHEQTAMADELAACQDQTGQLQEKVTKLEHQVNDWRLISIVLALAAALF